MEKDVRSDTSGHFKRLMISMLTVSDPASMHACIHVLTQFIVAGHGYVCIVIVGIQRAEWSSGQTKGKG